ncbi:ABC transporter substrate-binding protein [Phytopseudomonas punonensis]|uniref:Iron complex transport system substrate-binding protein n=1 Tax=Phytopseudomonas punonensis TaxID=1220495 RepID=A0A1M6XBU5_9GAMM|nr:ABC transporter substrate-binding protein [Pseudomonas punonensis]SHL03470.1 iron complex transport system substrate-binding protein [Pseudomonas punonensis]
MKNLLRGVSLLLCLFAGLAHAEPRVVALSWEATEHLLKLDIIPIAVADADQYRTRVGRPPLPAQVPSAGSRKKPNLERLAALKPDLIVIGEPLEGQREKLSRIAPVTTYGSLSQEHDSYLVARDDYLALAQRFGREDQALRELAAMQVQVDELQQQLVEHFRGRLPKVAVIRFSSPSAVHIEGAGSMVDHALQLLHLQNAYTPQHDGAKEPLPVKALAGIEEGVVLYVEPFPGQTQLFATREWRAMPFARADRLAGMPAIWTHGGVFSIQYLAEAITAALLTLPAP